eukprot:7558715-Pyramimonas_sp.AAC.1
MKHIGDATFSCVTVSVYAFRLLRRVACDDAGAPCRTAHATSSLSAVSARFCSECAGEYMSAIGCATS